MFDFEALRRNLHKHPEVSGEEWGTSAYLKECLKQFSPSRFVDLADAGFAVIFVGNEAGKTILIRAELDALPIQEINSFHYKSENQGVSHKCGHDGHMAILCGVASRLNQVKLAKGRAILLFQPAEETGKGAKAILEHESFEKLPEPDFVFSLHNIPKMPKGMVLLREGVFTASVKSWAIRMKGKTAHAASPEHGVNPALAISELIKETQNLIQSNIEESDFQLITPICVRMGELAYGISAGDAEVHFTVRTWENSQMDRLVENLERLLETICLQHKLDVNWAWLEEFHANQNDLEAVDWLRKVANQHKFETKELAVPFKFGEDFGLFTTQFKGAMFGLGAGENHPELHNPDYDFPDEIAPIGIQMFESLIREISDSK